jgi:hypothetical protein
LIIELLAPDGFALLSERAIELLDKALAKRGLQEDERVRDVFGASCAEVGIWSQSTFSKIAIPLEVSEPLLTSVEYKCNTFSTTLCKPHISVEDEQPEYVFFFTSDYWKTRRLFGVSDILKILVSDPKSFRSRIAEAKWDFTPNDPDGSARDLTVMLWSAKAHVLAGTEVSEARRRLIEYASETNLSRVHGFRVIRPGVA